jgi:hypothetical protein
MKLLTVWPLPGVGVNEVIDKELAESQPTERSKSIKWP